MNQIRFDWTLAARGGAYTLLSPVPNTQYPTPSTQEGLTEERICLSFWTQIL